jgi:hypothetical protein
MKKCPFCTKPLQDVAHHCHHCNSNLIDMDGNPIGKPAEQILDPGLEKVEIAIKAALTVFFTVVFFILGLTLSGNILGQGILELKSPASIAFNFFLLVVSLVAAMLLSPQIVKWIKAFLG